MKRFFRAIPFEQRSHSNLTASSVSASLDPGPSEDIVRCIDRAAQGDMHAFREIVDQYGALMLNTAIMIVGDRDIGEDVVQDALIEAWKHIGDLRDPHALRSWLLRIVVNQCNSLRRQLAHKAALARRVLLEREIDHASQLSEASSGRAEGDWDLAYAVKRLPMKQRIVIVLHYYNGMRLAEMAQNLGISENTLKKRIQVALVNLRRILHNANC